MSLESRVLSDARIRELAESFVCVKVDPRSPGSSRDAFRHKSTQYVPEVVFLDPQGRVVGRLEDRTVDGVVKAMKSALSRAGRPG